MNMCPRGCLTQTMHLTPKWGLGQAGCFSLGSLGVGGCFLWQRIFYPKVWQGGCPAGVKLSPGPWPCPVLTGLGSSQLGVMVAAWVAEGGVSPCEKGEFESLVLLLQS